MPGTNEREIWPAVTCLCPTYGRFERLQDAVACFLLQDYPGEAELLILNDAAVPIEPGAVCGTAAPGCGLPAGRAIHVVHAVHRYANLGAKRQALLEAADTPLVAHWDDDDLYLPWHLTSAVQALGAACVAQPPPAGAVAGVAQPPPAVAVAGVASAARRTPAVSCSKSRCGWWALGRRECWELQGGVHHNTFEGQMVFRRDRALELGGYPGKMSGQAADLLKAFGKAHEANLYRPADQDVSYVYRWADGVGHVSACPGDGAKRQMEWLRRNQDFGLGRDGRPQPLILSAGPGLWARARLAKQFRLFLDQLKPRLAPEAWQEVSDRITVALGMHELATHVPPR